MLALAPSLATAGKAHLILDANSGRVLASQNADVPNHPASLTKMMTLYLTFEALHQGKLNWNTKVRFSRNASSKPPTKLWVPAGSSVTVREAVLGMIVPSANDAAAAMAEKLAGSEAAFARLMTTKARQLGMNHTIFANSSGLPNPRQVTTVRDMSTLAVALMNDFPKEYELFSTRSFKFRGHIVYGHNKLMYRYKGMDGFKTGFTNASGFNLVSAVKRGGRRVIGVVMGGKTARSRDAKMAMLLDTYIPRASNEKTAILFASISPRRTVAVTIKDPPSPTPASRRPLEGRQVASASYEIANILTATSLSTGRDPASSGWQIQIAAADTQQTAIAALDRTKSRFGRILAGAVPHTEAIKVGGKTLYRARFAGFESHESANAACETLSNRHIACFAVRSHAQ
nr:D-alanyl-D-alanine carboxypeptidase [Rhizobium rhizogenes]